MRDHDIHLDDLDEDDVQRPNVPTWPLILLALPAFVAIWSGWVGLGAKTGFGVVHPLPGIWDSLTINTAITLPIGMETYAAYALWVWLARGISHRTLKFARASAIGALVLGALGQVTFHLLDANGVVVAHWLIIALVSCLPVTVLGMSAYLVHLIRSDQEDADAEIRRRRRERRRLQTETPPVTRTTAAATDPLHVSSWNGYRTPLHDDDTTLAERVKTVDRVSSETVTSPRGNGNGATSYAETRRNGDTGDTSRKTTKTTARKTQARGTGRRDPAVERRRSYVRGRLRNGHDVTLTDVKERFPDEKNPSRLVRQVRDELAREEAGTP